MDRRGFSLIETVIALAIVATVGTVATLQFNRMSRKAEGEREIRDLQSTLFSARLQAVQQRRKHAVRFRPGDYVFVRYSSEEEPNSGGTVQDVHPLPFPVVDKDGKSLAGDSLYFDTRGLSSAQTVRLADGSLSETLDCLAISFGRVNAGKMKGDSCVGR